MNLIYKGKIITVKTKKIKFPDNHTSLYEFVLHKKAVAIVPIVDNNRIMLVKQYRPVIDKKIWELPAGIIDKNETPFQAAKRELEEETGMKAGKIKKMGTFYSSPGFTDELTTIFAAMDLKKAEQKLDRDEDIIVKTFKIDKLLKMIKEKKLMDSKTVLGVLWVAGRLNTLPVPVP